MSIQHIHSVPLVVEKIAKFLAPKDILSIRLVCSAWAYAFEEAFIKTVPVVLNDSNLRDFTYIEDGSFRPRRMTHQSFCLLTRLKYAKNAADVFSFCDKFGAQIKTLHLVILSSPAELTALSRVLTAVKDTLEALTLCLKLEEHVEVQAPNFPIMPKLKSLSLVNWTTFKDEGEENQKFGPRLDGTTCFGLLPLVLDSWSNLQHLKVSGLPRFQTKIFKELRKESGGSMKLVTLELDQCPVSAMKCLSKIPLAAPLKHLRLSLYWAKEVHAPGVAPVPEDWQWPLCDYINRVLKHGAKGLESLDLYLKTIFLEELDEPGNIPRLIKFPTLPKMPMLRVLTLTASDGNKKNYHSQQRNFLDLQFNETISGGRMSPSFKVRYPKLEVLRIINLADADLAWNLISPDFKHHGLKRVEIQTVERSWSKTWRQSVHEKAEKAFPNATVNIILK